jgi:KUP system potassium uptake protein
MALGALGVVYGDIGTSVLYAFKECLAHGISSAQEIIGVLSLIIWSLVLLVWIKYIGNITRANNQGEGGILSLLSLAFPADERRRRRASQGMIAIGLAGAALLCGEGIITPAISVLSAVEGLLVSNENLSPLVVPLTLGILFGLFAVQSKGTGRIGKWFGLVMLVWFIVLAVLGTIQIIKNPVVLGALNPLEGIRFLGTHGLGSVAVMGGVFLVVTGCEALYADMGHFGRAPIALAWTVVVCPSLILNYLGQGALVLNTPSAREDPFYLLVGGWGIYPLIGLATAAAIIASQALIAGVFSLTMQGIQMGYIPRMEILHTSRKEKGQIYIPKVNILLGLGCAGLVLGFQSASALVSAYGIAVTLTMLATTILFYSVARHRWQWSAWRAGITCATFASIELTFFAANSLKIFHGGWFPLASGALIFLCMATWKKGRVLIQSHLPPSMPLDDFIGSLTLAGTLDTQHKLHRTNGTAVFLAGNPHGTPIALTKNIKHNQILHTQNIVLTILTDQTRPYVPASERVEIADRSEGFYRVVALFGFMETPHIGEVIRAAGAKGLVISPAKTTFFLGRERIIATAKPGMSLWREHLFVFLTKHSENAADFFHLPPDRVYEVSQVVEI